MYKVHHSRLLRFTGDDLPYWESQAEQQWGASVIESIFDELKKRDNVSWNIAQLTFMVILRILKMADMGQMLSATDEQTKAELYFNPVSEPSDQERADLAKCGTDNIVTAYNAGLISQHTALREMKQQSSRTGTWTNITDEEIMNASDEIEPQGEMGGFPGMGGEEDGDKPPEAPGKPPQAPKEAHDSFPFYYTASDDLDANGDNHDPSNGRFAPKGTGGGKKSLNDLKHTGRRAKLSPSGANSISVKAFGKKSHHLIHVNKHLKVEHEFKGMTEEQYVSEGVKLLESPVGNGIEGYMDGLGNIIRYDRRRNLIAIGNDGGLLTFYAPRDGHKTYLDLRARAKKNGAKFK